MARVSLLFLLTVKICFGVAQGLVATHAGAGVSGTAGTTGAVASIDSFQVVARIHNCTVDGLIYFNTAVRLNTSNNCTQLTFISWSDSSGGHGAVFVNVPAGATDILIRASRITSTNSLYLEVWRTDTGAYLSSSDPNIPSANFQQTPITNVAGQPFGIGNGGAGGCTCDVDYVRFFSGPPVLQQVPATNAIGNLGDWELDGTLADTSSYAQTATGSATYVNTPLYSPFALIGSSPNCFNSSSYSKVFCVYTSGTAITLSSNSYSPNTGDTLGYVWTQTSGPPLTIINPNTASPTITGSSVFGEYDFLQTVTDTENNQSSATLAIGIVTVDPNNKCLVSDVPTGMSTIIGPLVPWGSACNPWPYYDIAEVGDALSLYGQFSIPGAFTASPPSGTLTVQTNTTSLVGTGTHFTTDCAGGSCSGWLVMLEWNAPLSSDPVLPAGATGRSVQLLGTVTDDTHAVLDSSAFKYNAPLSSSASISYLPIGNWNTLQAAPAPDNWVIGFGWQGQPSYSWNYYDNVTAFYRIYYRTGISLFRDYARQLADSWYIWNIDQGYSSNQVPRVMQLAGIMARALDGQPNYWPGIELKLHNLNWFDTTPNTKGNWDYRESGYLLSGYALAAILDPNTGNRAGFCTGVSNAITYHFAPNQLTNGAFWINFFLINSNNPAYGQGSEPWLEGPPGAGLKDAYTALSGVCNNQPIASQSLTMMGNLMAYIYQYGISGTRTIPVANGGGIGAAGIWYFSNIEAGGVSEGQNLSQGNDWFPGSGTVSALSGSTTITGAATNFSNTFPVTPPGFSPCDGSTFLAIPSTGEIYRVTSCPTATSLTINTPLVTAISGAPYYISIRDATNACTPSLSTWCFSGSPDYAVAVIGDYGWYFAQTNNIQDKIWGDDWFAMDYGGPAGGPGASGPPIGPGSTGTTLAGSFGYLSPLPSCSVSAPPCGGGTNGHYGKDFGDGSGYAGAASNYLAWRLIGTASSCQAITPPPSPPQPTITTSSLSSASTGVPYTSTLAATGGTPGYTWTLSGGTLPGGLSLNSSTGVISGTPTTSGISSFTVQLIDTNTQITNRPLSISIASGSTFFVTQAGSGSHSGVSSANAWSVANFNATSVPKGGDTVLFQGSITSLVVPIVNGSGNGSGRLTLDFSGAIMSDPAVHWSGRSFLTLNGGPINETADGSIVLQSAYGVPGDCHDITIQNWQFTGIANGNTLFFSVGSCANVLVQNNTVDNVLSFVNEWQGKTHDITISNNFARSSGNTTQQSDMITMGDTINATITGNKIINRSPGSQVNSRHNDGIQTFQSGASQNQIPANWTIAYNWLEVGYTDTGGDGSNTFMIMEGMGSSNFIYGNVFLGDGSVFYTEGIDFNTSQPSVSVFFYNNTCVAHADSGGHPVTGNTVRFQNSGTLFARNNACQLDGSPNGTYLVWDFTPGATWDYNYFFNFPDCSGTFSGPHGSCSTLPKFNNELGNDFSAGTGSPLLSSGDSTIGAPFNQGIVSGATWPNPSLKTRTAGSWDIGAFQH